MPIFAHSRPNQPQENWELLASHAERVALLAEEFCQSFAPGYGRALGMLHDAGKYQPEFQSYLHTNSEAYNETSGTGHKTPHSIVGATWAWRQRGEEGLLLALPIEAHHGALKEPNDFSGAVVRTAGERRLASAVQGGFGAAAMAAFLPATLPPWATDPMAQALGIRMLHSALTDADMLETEAWFAGHGRERNETRLEDLLRVLENELAKRRAADATKIGHAKELAQLRGTVSDACRDAATRQPGRFRLTVPTGGGKTLSGMRFALRHAVTHGKRRIIVVIPYTSILEQTASVYRRIFDPVDVNAVIEHHSALDPASESQRHRLACENWDAPIVVTTSVQFFESLYANHKRPCRKLHRIANSVVLLDEVQTFPPGLIDPIQRALSNLATYFGTTVVSMTATQPLLAEKVNESEIMPNTKALYSVTRERFELEWMGDPEQEVEWDAIAARACREERVLAIVHRRQDAEMLARMVGENCFHLSARMCAAHRLEVLRCIKETLAAPGPCRVVATQLVEAGVDIDFPVVMRAMAGLETLAQAAGRCNREFGPQPGRFLVFRAPTAPPQGMLRQGLEAALHFYRHGQIDLCDPELFPRYIARVLQIRDTDEKQVLPCEMRCDFPESARRFRMIDDAGYSVVVPWGDGWERVQAARAEAGRKSGLTREALRGLQRYTVNVRRPELQGLLMNGFLEKLIELPEGEEKNDPLDAVWVVRGDLYPNPYSEKFGLLAEVPGNDALTLLTPQRRRSLTQ